MFKHEGFNYSVYPPAFSFLQKKALINNEVHTYFVPEISDDYERYGPLAFSFSQEEAEQIIENIKRSHQSIEKKIIDHYQSLGKNFDERTKKDLDYVRIVTDIDSKTKLSSITYSNQPNGVYKAELELYKTTNLHRLAKLDDSLSQQLENELDNGADINAMDENGKTALHWTAKRGHAKITKILLDRGADVDAKDIDGKTPFDLAKTKEIRALLLKAAEKADDAPVGELSKDNEENSEKDTGIQEKQEDDAQPVMQDSEEESQNGQGASAEQEKNKAVSSGSGTQQGEKGIDVKTEGVKPIAATESAQTEEQPSSFLDSLLNILMKPFSLIASLFWWFFSWLFGYNEEKADESTLQTDAGVSLLESSSLDDSNYDAIDLS